MIELHDETDLDKLADHLGLLGYKFHVTSQQWRVVKSGVILHREVIFEDEGGSSQAVHRRQGYENLKNACKCAMEHVAWVKIEKAKLLVCR